MVCVFCESELFESEFGGQRAQASESSARTDISPNSSSGTDHEYVLCKLYLILDLLKDFLQ